MSEAATFSKKNPLRASLRHSRDLTGEGAPKVTRHYEIDLMGSGLSYEPGDSLAVKPENDPAHVDELLSLWGVSPGELVPGSDKEDKPLREALLTDYAITIPGKKLLRALAEHSGEGSEMAALLEPERKAELSDYLWGVWPIDLLERHPEFRPSPLEMVGMLGNLNVRLYSISSSLLARPDEVDLTVATVRYEAGGRERGGVCSTWLERIGEGDEIPCFITPGKGFRLPSPEEERPIIMVGPGTGVAPFRSFCQHRRATGAKGEAWLFFGETHREHCFFYEDEWEDFLSDGTLSRIDTAFSRDQEHKIYVQHRLMEAGEELWRWLERGAIVYVCGDAERMAVDVDQALHRIVAEAGCKGEEGAAAYVEAMKAEKRYRRDVY